MTIGELERYWNDGKTGEGELSVFNPSNKERIGTLKIVGLDFVQTKLKEAQKTPIQPQERSEILRKAADLLRRNVDEAAEIITLENGKPLAESKGEVLYCADYLEWFAEEAKRIYGEILPEWDPSLSLKVIFEPIGVVGVITPWNFPLSMLGRKVGAAIAAGCTAVAKPAPETPFSALYFEKVLKDAGLPEGYFSVVISDAQSTGELFCKSPIVRKISFTGSTEVGRILSKQADLKKLTMELGGNAPALVLSDAPMNEFKKCGGFGKFRNAGQACTAINRFIVEETKYSESINLLLQSCESRVVGDGFDPKNNIGPLITEESLHRILGLIDDAVSKGAKVLTGEIKHHGQFLHPVLLDGVTQDMRIFKEEIFGPVVSVVKANNDNDAIKIANSTDYGLAAYIFTKRPELAKLLDFGMVGVNVVYLALVQAPFGGIKNSGFGREGGREGVKEYLRMKYVASKTT